MAVTRNGHGNGSLGAGRYDYADIDDHTDIQVATAASPVARPPIEQPRRSNNRADRTTA
ncbi:hypothetical protein Pme01_27080 [Planosporangium mesophilum]|uniref:Uncharacterized protein n=1 Tax=Planosporangium mesophilum TaxID=689768 RepID=A0A8J3TCX0_9ACTN|nr:hypothetical protein Pme01_27080 [Planosporangium mesophilum]